MTIGSESADYSGTGGDFEIVARDGVRHCFLDNKVLIFTVECFAYAGCKMLFSQTGLKTPETVEHIVPKAICDILRKQRNCPRKLPFTPPIEKKDS